MPGGNIAERFSYKRVFLVLICARIEGLSFEHFLYYAEWLLKKKKLKYEILSTVNTVK